MGVELLKDTLFLKTLLQQMHIWPRSPPPMSLSSLCSPSLSLINSPFTCSSCIFNPEKHLQLM